MKKIIWLLGALIIISYILITMIVPVEDGEIVVITQFGRPVRTISEAGPTLKLPDPIEAPIRLDKKLQLFSTPPSELVTRDRRNIILAASVIWRIKDGERFIQSVRNLAVAEGRIEDLVNAELGSAVGKEPVNAFLTTGSENNRIDTIMKNVTDSTHGVALQEFGIEVVLVRLNKLSFPKQNLSAVYRRMMSERERIAKRYRAEGQEQAAKIRAKTEREVRELLADSYRKSQSIKAAGEAEAARVYSEAYQLDPEFYQLTRFQDTYEKIIGKNTTLMLSTESPLLRYLTGQKIEEKIK